MNTLKLAWRNIFRNSRRSMKTIAAIAVGGAAVLVFGGYISGMKIGMQTDLVRQNGHIHLYKEGLTEKGAADPTLYRIENYEKVISKIMKDEYFKKNILVATPFLTGRGMAGNFSEDTSVTFFGKGVIPSDIEKIKEWNDYQLKRPPGTEAEGKLLDEDVELGTIGLGMAKILSVCNELKVPKCKDLTQPKAEEKASEEIVEDFSFLADEAAVDVPKEKVNEKGVRLDLMAAMAGGGSPNIVTLRVEKASAFPDSTMDKQFILMHLELMQQLVYGRENRKITGVLLQLPHTGDIKLVKERLIRFIEKNNLKLEVKDFFEIVPVYGQIMGLFNMIFAFIALIMAVIVLFTVANTMRMSVMERIAEIGTLRSLGLRQKGVARLFLVEGILVGLIGATASILLAMVSATLINGMGLSWVPPLQAQAVYIIIKPFNDVILAPSTWMGLVIAATLSSVFPARSAGKLLVVEALRHSK